MRRCTVSLALLLGLLVSCGTSPEPQDPAQTATEQWSTMPRLIIDLQKTSLENRTQIDLEVTNYSPHRLAILEADLNCNNVERQLTATVPVVIRDLGAEESRKLEPIVLDVPSFKVASSDFVIKKAVDDQGESVVFDVVWKAD